MKKNILLLILLLGFALRLYKIDSPIADWHSFRQADTASVTRIYVQEGINFLYPKYHDLSSIQSGIDNPNGYRYVEFPIYNAITAVLVKSIGIFSLEVWSRLVSIMSALVSAIFLYLIGEYFVGKWVGILAAFFYLTIPYNVYFTRVILPEPMAVTFATGSVWFFLKSGRKFNKFLVLSSIFLAISLLLKPFTLFIAFPIGIYYLSKYKSIKSFILQKDLWVMLIISLVPLLLWRIWISAHPEGIPFFWWMFNGDHIRFRPSFFKWIFYERLTKLILGIGGLIPFIFGLKLIKKNLLLFSFVAGSIAYVTVVATANVKHDYYQTFIIPTIALILAAGVKEVWLWGKGARNIIAKVLLVFLLLFSFCYGYKQVIGDYTINRYEIIDAGEALDRIAPANALVIAPYNGDTAFLYQTKRKGWPVIDSSIDEIIAKGATYFISVDLLNPDTVDAMKRYTVVQKTDRYVIVDLTKKQ